MGRRIALCWIAAGITVAVSLLPSGGRAGIFDHKKGHPPSLTQVARTIDGIEEDVLDQGTVVIKQPDIWSEARMTMFRKEFEDTMRGDLTKFEPMLSARIARSDAATLSSETALAGALTPFTKDFQPRIGS